MADTCKESNYINHIEVSALALQMTFHLNMWLAFGNNFFKPFFMKK
jgi:hypothetical protein